MISFPLPHLGPVMKMGSFLRIISVLSKTFFFCHNCKCRFTPSPFLVRPLESIFKKTSFEGTTQDSYSLKICWVCSPSSWKLVSGNAVPSWMRVFLCHCSCWYRLFQSLQIPELPRFGRLAWHWVFALPDPGLQDSASFFPVLQLR